MTENILEGYLDDENLNHLSQVNSLTITDNIFKLILKEWFSHRKDKIVNWLNKINTFEFKFGTKEWADDNFNTHYACKHACWYCYAWCEAYQRHRDYFEDWGKRMTLRKYWDKGWQTREDGFTIMYPTTHDILPEIMDESFQAIQNMLDANINVLVVSKPHLEVIKNLVERFSQYKKGQPKIILRFSIGTDNNELLSFWEPKAPTFEERFESLKYSYRNGFRTSVSMEPFFPAKGKENDSKIEYFILLVNKLLEFVRGTLWIGEMNHIPVNVQRGSKLTSLEKEKINALEKFYSIDNILKLVRHFYEDDKIRWKESIKKDIINLIRNSD
jgi:DNA repair photolyase